MRGSVQPLGGIRVLDVSGPIGAYTSRLLTGLGADVVLVEAPGDGRVLDSARERDTKGAGALFAYYHGGQRSVVLDATEDTALGALQNLGHDADVILMSPSSTRPLVGFDAEARSLSWAGEDTIVCSISPFGLTGPYRHWRSTPFVSYAMSGDMYRAGPPEGPPLRVPARIAWDEAGIHATVGVLAALLARDEVGGQLIDVSVHDVLCAKDFRFETYSVNGQSPGGRLVGVGYPPTGTWTCADGVIDVAAHQASHWGAFLDMLDHPEELSAPALADALVRRDIFDGLVDTIAPLLAGAQSEVLVERGQRAGLPCARFNTPEQFVGDTQLAARRFFVTVDDPELGPLRLPGAAVDTSPPMFRHDRPAPRIADRTVGWEADPLHPRELARPLHGVRVLSFGAFVAGNTAAGALADLGADVVKIEPFARPEVLRTAAYSFGRIVAEPSGVTNTLLYAGLSRNTRSLSLEMHNAEGRDLFRQLVRAGHVVIENFGSADEMANWDCSFDELRAINPELVMLSLSGYGRSGPRQSYRAYASNISAFTGLSAVWGHTHGTLTDYLCAAHGVVGILAALAHGARGGEGVWIDAAQIETTAAVMAPILVDPLVNDRDVGPRGNDTGALLSGAFPCAGDDRWVALEIGHLADWRILCELLERDDLAVDSPDAAFAGRGDLEAALGEWTSMRTPHTVALLLQARGLAAGAVQDTEDVARDPALRTRAVPVEIVQPDLGTIEYAQSPYRMSATPGHVRRCGPRLGQHTSEVLHEWLGLDDTEIAALTSGGAVFVA
ncbi:MAG TPA: CoA transferase [Acidimicrobiia bacterium]|nr:CoA transferase [Acidimicrobiia bacterium]